MKACVGFGHKEFEYENYVQEIEKILVYLIEKESVSQFYFGGRGAFDSVCSAIVRKLKTRYPHITNTLFLSYLPSKDFVLPPYYDDSEYILERPVPPRFAILETNKAVVDKCDFVLSGVI
jgi:hypothetical protein